MKHRNRFWLLCLFAALALGAAACGGDEAADPAEETEAVTEEMTEEMTEDSSEMMTEDSSEMMSESAMMTSGPACADLPAEGEDGSLDAMSAQPAATAASTNPLLTTLVSAVQQADLVDTLNSEGPFTIFAPVNEAFEAVPEEDLNALLADQEGLTNVLTYHVHAGEALNSDQLAEMPTLAMVNEGEVELAATGDTLGVNGQADVVCANIQVGNGIVHLIDGVLLPS